MDRMDFNEKKGFICDMDGVIYHGNRILPGVLSVRHRRGGYCRHGQGSQRINSIQKI